ncbi:MAG TPA: hypothetical protein VMT31_07955, partial [Methanomicrobiales archaeon]|nr:hypothetical protein [Methanomicrobiales archaeon]
MILMINPSKLVEEDLGVVRNYLELNQFDKINIIGNRILQNLYGINEKKLMVIGLIIKEISADLQIIRAIHKRKPSSHQKKGSPKITLSDDINNAVPLAKECIEAISANLADKYSYYDCWVAYLEFEDKIRKFLISHEERDKYSDDHEFSTLSS